MQYIFFPEEKFTLYMYIWYLYKKLLYKLYARVKLKYYYICLTIQNNIQKKKDSILENKYIINKYIVI